MAVKLGIISFGGMGKWRAKNGFFPPPPSSKVAGVQVAAVCDIAEERWKEAETGGYKLYKSGESLLADPNVNTVGTYGSQLPSQRNVP
ncbi:MAG: hypothetical protein LBG57_06810 [Treponema sp.]|jgi:predicted dehydrogenase|nr:hypothetical protein [Treponema sp.]